MFYFHKTTGVPDRYKPFNNHRFTFKIYDVSKEPSVFCNEQFKDDGTGINIYTGIAFRNTKEFSAFVDLLRPAKVKQRIKEGKTSLFSQGETVISQHTTLPQFTENKQSQTKKITSVWHDRNVKKRIANEALERWKNNAKKASNVK